MRFMVRIAKSMKNENDSFEKIKKEIIAHLRSLEDKETGADIKKALAFIKSQEHMFSYLEKSLNGEWIEKAGYSVGTVRIWKGKKYKKIAPGKWVRVFDKTNRGAKNAITRLVHKAEKIDSPEEMMQFVLLNKQRFSDANGKPLDIIDRLQKVIDAKNEGFDKRAKGNGKKGKKMDSILYERTESVHDKMPFGKMSHEEQKPQLDLNISRNGGKVKKTIKDIRNHYESSKSIVGNKKTIYASDEKIKGHWKLVEADAPMASHDEKTFSKTDGFPESKNGGTINDRDYEHDKDAQESVRDIAANFNGRALDMGEPVIVTKDGIVVSGNNRTMSSKLAAKNGTDKQYLADLKEQIEDFGFDEEDLDGFKHPRIVFEIDSEHEGDYTTEEFAKFNKTGKKAKNSTEKAVEISKTVKPESVKIVSDVISSYDTMGEMWADRDASRKIMNSFVESGVIGKNDMAQYYTEEGGMSAAGKEFVETCLIGSIMNEMNIRTLSGDGGKSIRQKLVRAIVPLIENKGDGKEYSFNNELNEAVRIASFVAKNHNTYPTIKTYFAQQDMFESEANPIVKKLAELIHDNTQKEFAEQMKNLEAGIRPNAAGEMDIFLGECETRNSVISRILRIKDTVKKSIFTTFDYVQKSIENLKKCKAI